MESTTTILNLRTFFKRENNFQSLYSGVRLSEDEY